MTHGWKEKIPCPECGELYTRRGLGTHRFTVRCDQNQEIGETRREIQAIIDEQCQGKSRVNKVFVKALERRGLRDFVGVLCLRTKIYTTTDGDWERKQEYWADTWAAEMWRKYLDDKRLKVYDDLERLSKLTPDERELHMQLLTLKYTDICG